MGEKRATIVLIAKVLGQQAVNSLNKSIHGLNKTGTIAARGVGTLGHNLSRLATGGAVAAGGALAYAVKQAIDWESAVADVNKTIEGTPAQLAAIEAGLRAMAREMPVAAADLATIAANAGALGIATDDILAFTKTVALLGATTDVTVDDASMALGQLQNVLGLTGADFDNFAATLVDLGNKGASTESQILEIARRAGGSAKLIGIAKDETLGWAAAAANLGMEQELAGTSLQRMFLIAMPKFMAGNRTLQKVMGLTGKQLKATFQKDAGDAIESLLAKIGSMPKDQRLAAVQKIFGKGTGLTRLVLGLADSMDRNLKPSLDNSTKAWKDNTAATEEAEKRFKTVQSQLQILRNNVNDAAITIGTALLPSIAELSQEATGWIQAHQPEIKSFAEDLAEGFREGVKWAKQIDWGSIGEALKIAGQGARVLVDVFMAMPAEAKGVILALAGLNKLSGGAVTGIIGELGKGLIRGVLGMNAGVVNINAGVVNAGGVGGVAGAAGKGGGLVAAGKTILKIAIPAAVLAEALNLANEAVVTDLQARAGTNIASAKVQLAEGSLPELQTALRGLQEIPSKLNPIQRLLYDNNAWGVKAHNEAMQQAYRAEINRRTGQTALEATFGQVGSLMQGELDRVRSGLTLISAGLPDIVTAEGAAALSVRTALGTVRAGIASGTRETGLVWQKLGPIKQAVDATASATRQATNAIDRKDWSPHITVPVTVSSVVSVRSYMNGKVVVDAYTRHKRAGG